ncbi:MAG: PAS domain-containing protein [Elusimicrobiota bacterium]
MAINPEPRKPDAAATLTTWFITVQLATSVILVCAAIYAVHAQMASVEVVGTVAGAIGSAVMWCSVFVAGRILRQADRERARQAENMSLSHERFVRTVEGSSDGLWDWDIVSNQVYFSPRYKSMLGYADSEINNDFDAWERLIHPGDLPLAKQRVADYHAGRIPVYELEHRLLQKDGTYRWVLARGTILRGADGKPVRMSGSHTDIDARKHMEEALRESEQRFRQVAENIREVIWLSDAAKNQMIYISPGYELVWGRTCQSLYDFPRTWAEGLHPEDRERVLEAAVTKQARGDYDETYRIIRPDGEVRWIRDRAFPVRDENKVVYRVAGLAEDVTESRLRDAELRDARDAALASDQAKSEFLANISHEMRTPLNAILGMCELMTGQTLPEPHASRAKLAHDAVGILTATIDDLLDLSKIEAGHLTLDPKPTDLRELIGATFALMEAQAYAKGVKLKLDVDQTVPMLLSADPLRLRQVLSNLMNNALKFTERGSVCLTVSTEPVGEKGVFLNVAVRDTGIGIAPEVQGRLFQPFTQADASTTRRYGGTGLGLAISRRLIESMGGKIGVESALGAGSIFWFRVPLPIAGAPAPAEPAPAAAPDLSRLRALIVEDNETNRIIALDMLAHLGVKAEAAGNGAQALEKLSHSTFDLVFMDCSMPVMDGYTATETWRRLEAPGARLPIVAMTAYALQGDREKCLAAGMDDYIAKPLRLKDFVATLARWGSPVDPDILRKAVALVGQASPRWKAEYLQDARRLLLEMRASKGESLLRAAHTLKGASLSLGARRLSVLCARIEAAGTASPELLDEAARELELVAAALA